MGIPLVAERRDPAAFTRKVSLDSVVGLRDPIPGAGSRVGGTVTKEDVIKGERKSRVELSEIGKKENSKFQGRMEKEAKSRTRAASSSST